MTTDSNAGVGLRQFAAWVRRRWDVNPRAIDLPVAALGLCGEAGEVVEHIKKEIRDRTGQRRADPEALKLELGDVLHYWCVIATHYKIDVQDIIDANVAKLTAREAAEVKPNYLEQPPLTATAVNEAQEVARVAAMRARIEASDPDAPRGFAPTFPQEHC